MFLGLWKIFACKIFCSRSTFSPVFVFAIIFLTMPFRCQLWSPLQMSSATLEVYSVLRKYITWSCIYILRLCIYVGCVLNDRVCCLLVRVSYHGLRFTTVICTHDLNFSRLQNWCMYISRIFEIREIYNFFFFYRITWLFVIDR